LVQIHEESFFIAQMLIEFELIVAEGSSS